MGRAFEYRRAAKEARWGKMSRIFPKIDFMFATVLVVFSVAHSTIIRHPCGPLPS